MRANRVVCLHEAQNAALTEIVPARQNDVGAIVVASAASQISLYVLHCQHPFAQSLAIKSDNITT